MNTKVVGKLWPSVLAVNIAKVLSVAVVAAAFAMGGLNFCQAAETNAMQEGTAVLGSPLRVGIAPEYPPLAFRKVGGLDGLEVDFANALGQELGRPVKFEVMPWDRLIDSLLDQRIDIIMSGMSITKARQLRVSFSTPYAHNQLRAIFPLKSAAQFKTKADVLKTTARIGVITGTVADTFVKQNCTNAQIVGFAGRENIPYHLLKGGRMDLFIDDTFALADMFSKNEADMAYLPEVLSEDQLAWGMRPGDAELLLRVDQILSKWKSDGTLDQMLTKRLPYIKNLNAPESAAPK